MRDLPIVAGTLVGGFVSIVVGVLASNAYNDLQHDVENKRREIANANVQMYYVEDTLIAANDVINSIGNLERNICTNITTTKESNNCSLVRSATNPEYTTFLRGYSQTAALRIRASTEASYRTVENQYRELARSIASKPWAEWQARTEEGIAWAQWKQGKLDEAAASISRAKKYDPSGSAFVGLTGLKIDCARGVGAAEVAASYESIKSELERRVREERMPAAKISRQLELRYFRGDAEVYLYCPDVKPAV